MQGIGTIAALLAISAMTVDSAVGMLMHVAVGPVIEGTGYIEEPIHPGQRVIVPWEIAKRTDCPGSASRVWTGNGNYLLVEKSRPTSIPPSEGFKSYNIETLIPESIPYGPGQLKIKGSYQCGGVSRDFSLGPVDFVVIPAISNPPASQDPM